MGVEIGFCILGWPQIFCVVEDNIEFLILLPPSSMIGIAGVCYHAGHCLLLMQTTTSSLVLNMSGKNGHFLVPYLWSRDEMNLLPFSMMLVAAAFIFACVILAGLGRSAYAFSC